MTSSASLFLCCSFSTFYLFTEPNNEPILPYLQQPSQMLKQQVLQCQYLFYTLIAAVSQLSQCFAIVVLLFICLKNFLWIFRQSAAFLVSSSDCVYSTSAGFASGCFLLANKVSVGAICYFETFSFSSSGRLEFSTTSILSGICSLTSC